MMIGLAHALPATLVLLVQTVLAAQQATVELTALLLIPAKPLYLLLTMGRMVTSTASTGATLAELQIPAPALIVILDFTASTAKTLIKSIV